MAYPSASLTKFTGQSKEQPVLAGALAGFAQDQGQRHGKAAGMGGADQFFGIGAGLALEPAGEAVRIIVQRAALGRDYPLAVLKAAAPRGGSPAVP